MRAKTLFKNTISPNTGYRKKKREFMKKKTLFSNFLTLLIVFLMLHLLPNTFAQDNTQWGVPEGARVRLGKGRTGEMLYSPDGTLLAVASGIGIWLYDTANLSRD